MDGHLIAHHWAGWAWNVEDHGLPPGGGMAFVHAITYTMSSGNRVIDVFCSPGDLDTNKTLSLRRTLLAPFASWFWTNQGGPDQTGAVSAIVYVDEEGARRIHAFVAGTVPLFAQLYMNAWTGASWYWAHLSNTFAAPTAISYASGENRIIYVFGLGVAIGDDNFVNHLRHIYWNGSAWYAVNHGTIGDLNNSLAPPTAITYVDNQGKRHIDVFAVMHNDVAAQLNLQHLVVRSWNGSSWSWIHHGLF
jgi:hypothetical protein